MSNLHADTVAYVRDTMLPEREPPASEVGIIGWGKQNLFTGPFNTIVTVLCLAFIGWLLWMLVPWFFAPTWEATSLAECREMLTAAGMVGEHGTFGACWGVIRERWIQLIFGFYPAELYWRPILAFVLLFVALAPVLFSDRVPSQLLWFTAVYPFLFPWLLWGGPIWGPICAALGFVILFAVVNWGSAILGRLLAIIVAVVAAAVWWLFLSPILQAELTQAMPLAIDRVVSRDFGGMLLSITIGVVAIACSLPLGIVLALGRQSDLLIVKSLCVGFIEFIRGVPLITLLFVASTLLNIFLPPGTSFDIILRVIIMATLFASAYMAEVIRGGLAALPKGQYEGADSLGLDYWQAQRLIIMPQALKISIPGIVSTFIGLFKDTTLVSVIGLLDPLGLSNSIRADQAWNGVVWELYGFIAVMFFIFCFGMSRYSMYLERKLQTGHR